MDILIQFWRPAAGLVGLIIWGIGWLNGLNAPLIFESLVCFLLGWEFVDRTLWKRRT